jgi:molybdenum cofactor cytidylyltransferase
MKLSILILAAGNSSRLGHPKQLVEFRGETLIERTIKTALIISEEILVVLGANSDLIESQISPFSESVKTIHNPDWQAGMGTSIRIGVEVLAKKSDTILILLSDQPFISQEFLQNLLQTFAESNNLIAASCYENELGVPMIFDKSIFPELLKLDGEKGAKSFLNKYRDTISIINFPEGNIDIDTPEDLEKLLRMS